MNRREMLKFKAAGAVLAAAPLMAGGVAMAQATGDADAPRQALASSSGLEDIKKRGSFRIGLSTFVPWSMRNKQGELVGFEVDVATKLARDFGLKAEFVPTAWDGIIPALLAGRFDVIIGGMSITQTRNLTINFSEFYHTTGLVMFANKRLASSFTKLEDFNKAGVTIVCRRGTPSSRMVANRLPKATLRQFDEESPAVQEVVQGRAHAMVASSPLHQHTTKRFPNEVFIPFPAPIEGALSAIGVRKGDPDLLNALNNWIIQNKTVTTFLADRNEYWFNGLDWEDQIQRG
jgi:polar amino acid transport system substrate-binding protein